MLDIKVGGKDLTTITRMNVLGKQVAAKMNGQIGEYQTIGLESVAGMCSST